MREPLSELQGTDTDCYGLGLVVGEGPLPTYLVMLICAKEKRFPLWNGCWNCISWFGLKVNIWCYKAQLTF